MAKYLIIKGCLGFGDRLEVVKMWIQYAISNNIKVFIDWRDEIWSHGNETFYSYFKLVNIPTFDSIDEIPEDAIVFPALWKGKLDEQLTGDFMKEHGEKLFIGTLHTGIKVPDNIDVIVASCGGYRTLFADSTFFCDIFRVIHPTILQRVKERLYNYDLRNCVGVHIRGTDRKRNELQFTQKIQWMTVNAVHNGGLNGEKMIAVTDDKTGAEIWKRFFPQTQILSNLSMQQQNTKGNHNLKADEITTSKDEMNIDMLVDFFTLSCCKRVLTTYKDSRFAQESQRLSPNVKRILGE